MLLDTLQDSQTYFKSTLVEVLQEVRAKEDLRIVSSYKSIMRREKQRIQVYCDVVRDPTNGWRMYTGRQIRKIVEYEIEKAKSRPQVSRKVKDA